ncbi:hypothetical protein P879_09911 [Paragonimus westermani]|uniref:HOOK N-terminal domain-containing protein n=1 Tax=Paragonimus westermani TaxID=34504 RepID=A0A8T0D4M1_9TREM|nr:hypothetical protein P879_09911 [Paragonimus westermani]
MPDEHIVVEPVPDLELIVERNDEDAAFRLLQLILGCAVNCESKQTYIEAIMCMEESVQHVLMEAIQQCPSFCYSYWSSDSHVWFRFSSARALLHTSDVG